MKNTQVLLAFLIALLGFSTRSMAQEEIQISLKPGGKIEMKVAANSSTLLLFRFRPDAASQKSIEDQYAEGDGKPNLERLKINDRRPLRVQLSTPKRTWQAEAELDPLTYTFSLPNGLKEAATLTIENISKSALAGNGRLDLLNASEIAEKKQQQKQEQIEAAMKEVKNTDAVYFVQTMFKRHLAGYPGGKGDIDEAFEQKLQENNVSNETIELLVNNMGQFEDEVKAKVQNKKLLSEVKSSSPVSTEAATKAGMYKPEAPPTNGVGTPFTDQFKYSMSFLGIKSHRCADDEGWEYGCDAEEGWVNYFAVGSGLFASGASGNFSGMVQGSERLITSSVFTNKRLLGTVIFLYQVVEDDSGGPTKAQFTAAFASALSASVQAYGGNYSALAGAIWDVAGVIQSWMAGPDDLYPIYINVIDSQKLHQYSTGTTAPPSNKPLFSSHGIYRNQLTIQVVPIKKGSTTHWTIAYRLQGIKA